MTSHTIITCDRCFSERKVAVDRGPLPGDDFRHRVSVSADVTHCWDERQPTSNERWRPIDLCEGCQNGLVLWLREGREEHMAPEATL